MPTLALAIDARGARRGQREFDRAVTGVERGARNADRSIRRVDSGMERLGRTASSLRSMLLAAFAGIGATLAVREAVQTLSQYEETLATVRGVSFATRKEFEAYNAQARELGAVTRFSAKQAAEGQLFLARAGFKANEILTAMPGTLLLAQAGQLDLGRAADIASNVLSQFNLEAEEMGRVGDVLAMTANSANTDIEQLAQALKFAGPVAGALGVSLEETAAAIGVLGNAGIQGAMAGTNVRGVLSSLLGPTSMAEEALAKMGLTVEEMNPATNNFIDIIERLADKNLTAAQAVEIFGRRNAAAAIVLSRNVETVRELSAANEEAAGITKLLAEIQDNTLVGSFKALISVIEEAILQTGDKGMAGALRIMIDTTVGAIRILVGLEDQIAHITPAMRVIAVLIQAIGYGLAAWMTLGILKFLGSLAVGLMQVATSATAAKIGLYGVIAPLAAIGIAIMGFEIGSWLYDEFKVVRQVMDATAHYMLRAWTWIKHSVIKLILEIGKALADELETMFGWMGDWFWDVGNLVGSAKFKEIGRKIGSFGIDESEMQHMIDEREAIREREIQSIIDSYEKIKVNTEIEFGDSGRKGESFIARLETDLNKVLSILQDKTPEVQASLTEFLQTADGAINEFFGSERYAELDEELQTRLDAMKARIDTLKEDLRNQAALIEEEVGKVDETFGMSGEELKKMEEERIEASKALADIFNSLREERKLIMLTDEARERSIGLRKLETLAMQAQIDNVDEVLAAYEKELELTQRLREQKEIADDASGAFQDFGESILTGAQNGIDALKDLGMELYKIILQTALLKPLGNMFGNAFSGFFNFGGASALGNVFSGGRIVPFASGGVVSQPTFFPMTAGKTGLMGEAGPEGILPLTRNSRNQLSVNATGMGGGTSVTVNVHGVRNMDEFRRAETSIEMRMAKAIRKAQERR